MITIKDYAKDKGISYEAVRKQVKRYKEELKDHISIQNRTQFLDDYAVDFLNEKRNENPIIIQEQAKDEELERLREENKNLLMKMVAIQDKMAAIQEELNQARKELSEEKDQIKQMQAEQIVLLEQKLEPAPAQEQPEQKHWWNFWKKIRKGERKNVNIK